ncbi:hypothetical protein COY17_01080 [Candidatus Saccharibacteria bacterium CG_4_10_14_0_2_um_filter_52_9]|nr:MAG: hypothetical protein COY17_01080 [Candidatus Saccharibacteria bacterium CG_4_10_14_0_2_um_filter_52_9]
MVRKLASKVTITVPADLLELTDEAVDKEMTSRSDIIRLALLDYLRSHPSEQPLSLLRQSGPTEDQLNRMRQDFPNVAPDDIELLQFLTYYKFHKEQG